MQASASITNIESPWLIAFVGHSEAQAPQFTQASVILYAIYEILLLKILDEIVKLILTCFILF